ncbi:hypothetical protein Hypma_011875 [Hypsizygus marmoreus]|uniref:Uncharacterized protein n=1 Tax=Hypsizygus marmoreus TaxID=39966 RepID=A0A369JGX2_HYPMA|nr:hypothetical protein Hypma_011875 [Hypsizygus marmoreus]
MVIKVLGYLIHEDAMLQHGLKNGIGTDENIYARSSTIDNSFLDIAARGGVLGHARWVCVNVRGELRRCIALANNDRDDLLSLPPREQIDQLKAILNTKAEPKWYLYD